MAIFWKKNNSPGHLTPDSSSTNISLLQTVWIARFGWLIPISVVLAVYYVGINNYFTSDDFMWLDRARTFKQDWLKIFRSDVAYFDPLVHLLFVSNYLVTGLDHRWYHGVDLAIHAANSLLVYRFARLLSRDERAAIYGSILFAGCFATADAVLWSSSRVDLLSTFFFLGALIQYLHHLHDEKRRDLLFSLLLFILALGAKGTPLILPLVLLWLTIQEKRSLRYVVRLIPFGVVAIIYVVLLKLTAHLAALPLNMLNFNIRNIVLAFCTQFIPEDTLTHLNLIVIATLLFAVISALALTAIYFKSTVMLRRTGFFILLTAILPVLIIDEFTLATNRSNFIDLMGSPSHRIYLASVGTALFGGGILRSIETLLSDFFPKFALLTVGILLAGVVTGDAFLVRERDKLWETEGNKARIVVDFMGSYQGKAVEGSLIGLIGFPHSTGAFMESTMKELLGVKDATFNHYVDIGMIVDSKILKKAEKSYLFVFGRDGHIYDKSQMYRQQLLLSRRAINNFNNSDYISEAQTITFNLIREINYILGL